MKIKCLWNLAFIVFLFGLAINQAQAGQLRRGMGTIGKFSLRGHIIHLNEDYSFVVINLGSADGVKKGMVFSVFQKDEEAAKIKVAEVRRHISGCAIQLVYTGRGIGLGDVIIYKQTSPIVKMFRLLEPTRMMEVEPIVVDIDAPKRRILQKTLTALKEFGVFVTELDPGTYTLKAYKDLEMPLNVGLLTEWGPFVKNKVSYTVEVISTPRYNRLIIRLRGAYVRDGQLYNHEIEKNSSTYKQIQELAFTIKDLAERL